MHEQGIAHMDIYQDNIFINFDHENDLESATFKLGDFNTATESTKDISPKK